MFDKLETVSVNIVRKATLPRQFLVFLVCLSIPGRLEHLSLQNTPPQLLLLVGNRIMQCMRPHIPPKPAQPHLRRPRPRPRDFKTPAGHPERRIRSDNLDARHPLCHLTTLGGGHVPLLPVGEVNVANFLAGDVSKGFGGAEVCEKGATAPQDVRSFNTSGDGLGGIWPGTGVFDGVGGGKVESLNGNTDVEV